MPLVLSASLVAWCAVVGYGGAWAAKTPPVTPVANVDLARYQGTWYEVAVIPNFFQRRCTGAATAVYTRLTNGLIKVVNTCPAESERVIRAEGRARAEDAASGSRLKVTFLNLFGWRFFAGGDYWVLGLDEGYQHVLVGEPGRRYGWVLSRTPTLNDQALYQVMAWMRQQHYDPCAFVMVDRGPAVAQGSRRDTLCKRLGLMPWDPTRVVAATGGHRFFSATFIPPDPPMGVPAAQ
jgi:apolipoprotein D and lipocalin family protein